MRITRIPCRQLWATRVAILLLACPCQTGGTAEMMAAAHSSIQAADAKRHISALADDALEGRECGSRGGRAAGSYIVSHLEKLGLEPAGDNGSYYQQFGGMRNILALCKGSDPTVAHELIVVGAHYDHVGYGDSGNSYGPFGFIHNGADDNASGVAGLIEIAEAMQHLPSRPRRPILFAFWDGEERGLLGSYHFLRVRPTILASTTVVFSVNLDMIGRLRGERLEVFGARTSEGLRAAVVQSNNRPGASPLQLVFDWAIEEDSDHYPFIVADIPTVMFHTGLHDQYHRPSDDVQLINFGGIEPVTRLALDFVTTVANDPGTARTFRRHSRSESNATKRAIETPSASLLEPPAAVRQPSGHRPRWGIGTRSDPGEPTAPVVVRITADSPAAAAGMALGDRLIAVDGEMVASQADMVARLAAAGDPIEVDIDRKGRVIRLSFAATQTAPGKNSGPPVGTTREH